MDESGVLAAAQLFGHMNFGTVLVVWQSNSTLGRVFEVVDAVVNDGDAAASMQVAIG